jgi:hypothetical protein
MDRDAKEAAGLTYWCRCKQNTVPKETHYESDDDSNQRRTEDAQAAMRVSLSLGGEVQMTGDGSCRTENAEQQDDR